MRPDCSGQPLTAQSDQQLLALVREGHERAFETLVRRYRRPLLRYCRRMHLSHTDPLSPMISSALSTTAPGLRSAVVQVSAWSSSSP